MSREKDFSFWKEEIADMPTQDDKGNWYDMETGIPYSPSPKSRSALSTESIEARKYSKGFGAKSVTGTLKQKNWVEKIRASKLRSLGTDEAIFIAKHDFSTHPKFWINCKNKTGTEIYEVLKNLRRIKELYDEYREKGDLELVRKYSREYNNITFKFGF